MNSNLLEKSRLARKRRFSVWTSVNLLMREYMWVALRLPGSSIETVASLRFSSSDISALLWRINLTPVEVHPSQSPGCCNMADTPSLLILSRASWNALRNAALLLANSSVKGWKSGCGPSAGKAKTMSLSRWFLSGVVDLSCHHVPKSSLNGAWLVGGLDAKPVREVAVISLIKKSWYLLSNTSIAEVG